MTVTPRRAAAESMRARALEVIDARYEKLRGVHERYKADNPTSRATIIEQNCLHELNVLRKQIAYLPLLARDKEAN